MNLSGQSLSTDFLYNSEENDNLEEEYCPQPEIHEKYQFNPTIDNGDDHMPYEYWPVWNWPWSVWEECYIAMYRMKSELHISDNQVEGSICICANILFGHNKFGKWKRYDKDQPIFNNTLPATTNSNRTEAYVETLILAGITNEIMLPASHTVLNIWMIGLLKVVWEIM